ncbi:MAG: metallophosphoesterase [Gemmatimonadetes bacterium]|nr:metallophosphoesterase [Gemmatimonadota bacterium]
MAEVPSLPAGWEGRQLAVIADLQIGMWGANVSTVRRAVAEIIAAEPAAVLLAGDFLYKPENDLEDQLERVTALVRPLAASGIPTFAVLGNHDWGLNWPHERKVPRYGRRLRDQLNSIGIRVLRNEAAALRISGVAGSTIYLVGVGDAWARDDFPLRALEDVPIDAPRIVLMHNPASFVDFPAGAAPIAVAAHTHGGQFALPFFSGWSWMKLVKGEPVPVDGWIEDFGKAGNHLYVNRGIGFSTVPIRINAVPEITWFTLQAAPVLQSVMDESPRRTISRTSRSSRPG